MGLTIVCLSAGYEWAIPFLQRHRRMADALGGELLLGVDSFCNKPDAVQGIAHKIYTFESDGIVERGLKTIVPMAQYDWALWLADDEEISPAMLEWLKLRRWEGYEVTAYGFPSAQLWGDSGHFISDDPLWFNIQARLLRSCDLSRWEAKTHSGPPVGGQIVPVMIKHHKFLIKDRAAREAIAAQYDKNLPGAGTGAHYGKFTLPEVYLGTAHLLPVGDGFVTDELRPGNGRLVRL